MTDLPLAATELEEKLDELLESLLSPRGAVGARAGGVRTHGAGFRAAADCLEIEIIENVLMSDIEHISRTLDRLSALGVHIAIDDFGTGYSSLAYLKKLPLKTLKIDKSFVLDMAHDDNDAVIVRSTIDLAHNLGYWVVAEGIENQATQRMLTELGCDGAQGFHFSHPVPAPDFTRLLAAARA